MPSVDLWSVVKTIVLLALVLVVLGAAFALLPPLFSGVEDAFHTSMTAESNWATQNETTGGEWVAMIFSAFPALRAVLAVMSGVTALVAAVLSFMWARRAFGI